MAFLVFTRKKRCFLILFHFFPYSIDVNSSLCMSYNKLFCGPFSYLCAINDVGAHLLLIHQKSSLYYQVTKDLAVGVQDMSTHPTHGRLRWPKKKTYGRLQERTATSWKWWEADICTCPPLIGWTFKGALTSKSTWDPREDFDSSLKTLNRDFTNWNVNKKSTKQIDHPT